MLNTRFGLCRQPLWLQSFNLLPRSIGSPMIFRKPAKRRRMKGHEHCKWSTERTREAYARRRFMHYFRDGIL